MKGPRSYNGVGPKILWIVNTTQQSLSVEDRFKNIFPQKFKDPQLVKKIPAIYGSGRFITVTTDAHHWALPWSK